MSNYNKLSFHKRTYCEFKMIQKDFFKEKSAHYKSKSGSLYYYTKEGVYRYSNHWGRVANCRWSIEEIEDYKNQNYYVGYANWEDFFKLNSVEKVFYLKVDIEKGISKILKENKSDNDSKYLMSLEFAFKRQKEIKSLFKNYKWAKYYNEDINVLRSDLIKKLINSNKTLQELKLNLKKSLFEKP